MEDKCSCSYRGTNGCKMHNLETDERCERKSECNQDTDEIDEEEEID